MRSRNYRAVIKSSVSNGEYKSPPPTTVTTTADPQVIIKTIKDHYLDDQEWLFDLINAARYVLHKNRSKKTYVRI